MMVRFDNDYSTLGFKSVELGYDRLTIWLDTAYPGFSTATFVKQGYDVKVECNKELSKGSNWKCVVCIHQPTPECLAFLNKKIRAGNFTAMVSYLEVTADLITRSQAQAGCIMAKLIEHGFLSARLASKVTKYESTCYFSPRSDGASKKNPINCVIYADRRSKLKGPEKGRPCCHAEFRFTGKSVINKLGIWSLEDVINFDHVRFWNKNFLLRKLPSKLEVAKLVDGTKAGRSGMYKRASNFMRAHEVQGVTSLQNLIIELPALKCKLVPEAGLMIVPENEDSHE